MDGLRLHDLRHFAATRLLAAGVPVRTVSGRLGHANAATTLGVYAHFLAESDQVAADVIRSEAVEYVVAESLILSAVSAMRVGLLMESLWTLVVIIGPPLRQEK